MRYGICVPNLGQFADPRQVGELARRAEEAGWDGFFVWDPFDGDQPSGEDPFDVVITGRTRPDQPSAAREVTGAIAAAGATWWLEGFRSQPGEHDAALRRIDAGPPR
jgi:alkanesulfonate monooxygenase SsuD/methylene tetrahydromethanopterin reductase-like flavin-dependent oxidoreductase (luciferase family)